MFEPKIKGKKRLVQSLTGAVLVFGNAPFHDAGHEQQSASIEEIQAKSENNLAHYAREMLSRISHSQSECNPLGFTQSLTVNDVLKSDLQLVGRENDQQKGVSLTSSNRGEILRTLVNEKSGMFLLMTIMPQVHYLQGDAVLAHVSPGLFRKGWRVNRQA